MKTEGLAESKLRSGRTRMPGSRGTTRNARSPTHEAGLHSDDRRTQDQEIEFCSIRWPSPSGEKKDQNVGVIANGGTCRPGLARPVARRRGFEQSSADTADVDPLAGVRSSEAPSTNDDCSNSGASTAGYDLANPRFLVDGHGMIAENDGREARLMAASRDSSGVAHSFKRIQRRPQLEQLLGGGVSKASAATKVSNNAGARSRFVRRDCLTCMAKRCSYRSHARRKRARYSTERRRTIGCENINDHGRRPERPRREPVPLPFRLIPRLGRLRPRH